MRIIIYLIILVFISSCDLFFKDTEEIPLEEDAEGTSS
ncbi:MAG: hypothetical protein KatS3mg129_1868 [Leptospiraceae bacterium]|nr:MAG: hypothetical protein KatS3mg129_1868 [Leptospiraceae bacterium]